MKQLNHIRSGLLLSYLLAGLIFPDKVFSQQEPQYTQYMHNHLTVNPAVAGTNDVLRFGLLSRLQWTGLEGAPHTYNFNLDTPVRNYKMGLGLSIVADDYGPVSNLFLNLHYAYRVNITSKIILSMGINGGIYNYHVGLTDLDVETPDPAFSGDIEQQYIPNAGAGFYLYSPNFFVGASFPRMFQTTIKNDNAEVAAQTLHRHFYFMGGYNIKINSQVILEPSIATRITEGSPFSADITIRGLYQNTYGIGFSYRPEESLALMASLQISDRLMIGYAYDFPQSELRTFSDGSHEMVILFSLTKIAREKIISPRDL